MQNSAEHAVRDMLKEISLNFGLKPVDTLHATDYMDDGKKKKKEKKEKKRKK